eukprot:augustus_masked-scaffold_12-processed-gene-12.80-mRNA-1 protein AED:0.23 eAED:0.23 QI:0/-1/0/1/-1/1/1/0/1211
MRALLISFLYLTPTLMNSQETDQDCASPLHFNALPGRTCLDGSTAGFYSSLDPVLFDTTDFSTVSNYVIWLGDSELCENQAACNSFCDTSSCSAEALEGTSKSFAELSDCFLRQLTCSSDNWPKVDDTLCAETILDASFLSTDSSFLSFYLPQCTMDWFLGQTSPFTGSETFEQFILTLASEMDLDSTKRIIFGGNRGGGIGAANLVAKIRENAGLEEVQIDLILDSSFLFPFNEFSASEENDPITYPLFDYLVENSEEWIENSYIDASCVAALGNNQESIVNCLYLGFLFSFSEHFASLENTNILILQSEYDIVQLLQLELLEDDKPDNFGDADSYTVNLFSFIESFGSAARANLNSTFMRHQQLGDSNVFILTSSCGVNSPLVPISLVSFPSLVEDLVLDGFTVGSVELARDGSAISSLNFHSAIEAFVKADYLNPALEPFSLNAYYGSYACKGFLCEDTCSQIIEITPFTVLFNFGEGSRALVELIGIAMVGSSWLMFVFTYFRARSFKLLHISRKFTPKKNQDLVYMLGNRTHAISLCLKHYHYYAPPRGDSSPVEILKGVNIAVLPGKLHAVMGSSGSGKSSLLDVLSNLRTTGSYTGEHLINGVPSYLRRSRFLNQYLRNNMSYVKQQDVLFDNLTVRESLTHSAWLTLPQSLSANDKRQRVHVVSGFLGLESVMDTKIGKISGGQKRRVSVGTQLLSLPSVLFLDEPTTGLDATNALVLCDLLYKLAHVGKMAILMTIHQPRREIFSLMDKLSILVNGKVAFSGTPNQAAKFFRVDFNEVNMGNTILDRLEDYTGSKHADQALNQICKTYEKSFLGQTEFNTITKEESYLTKNMANVLEQRLKKNAKISGMYSWSRPTSTFLTLKVLLSRTLLWGGFDIFRTCSISLVGGLLVGSVYLQSAESFTNITSLNFLSVASMAFLQGTFLGDRYQLEKGMWSHETTAGTRVSWRAFLLNQFLRNAVASTLEALFFAVPVYMLVLEPNFGMEKFFQFVFILLLVSWAVVSQNTLVEIDRIRAGGVSGPDLRQAALINMTLLSLGVLFNGFIIQLQDIPIALSWVPFVMLSFWGFVGLLGTLFRDFSFPCGVDDDLTILQCSRETGDVFLTDLDYDSFDAFQCMTALLAMIAVFHVLGVFDFYQRFIKTKSNLKKEDPKPRPGRTDGYVGNTMDKLVNRYLKQAEMKAQQGKNNVTRRKSNASEDSSVVV